MTREEYNYALSLPEDSPHLLSSYYNNALSKVNYKYALKSMLIKSISQRD